MEKNDLTYGNVVELRDGTRYLYYSFYDNSLIDLNGYFRSCLDAYSDELNHKLRCDLDIMKVYNNYTCSKLLWERKEKPKLTEVERTILENLDREYEWIVRGMYGDIWVYKCKPDKDEFGWNCRDLEKLPFRNLFQFIKWEDEEPYLIEDLLKERGNN